MNLPFIEQTFISAKASWKDAWAVILGCPYDGSASFRPGARFGPSAIRRASWGIETYSPYQNQDLTQCSIHDMGDLEFPLGEKKISLDLVRKALRKILSESKFPILLGGDHLITLPSIEELYKKYPQLQIIHMDAHTDLREEYLGESVSHCTVMRKLIDHIGRGKLFQIGIRSGTKEEFKLASEMKSIFQTDMASLNTMLRRIGRNPVYVSLDLDVLDPSVLPGVGTPEPGGLSFREVISIFKKLQSLRVIGFDIVELTPDYDPTQVSSVTASVILREMILAFCKRM